MQNRGPQKKDIKKNSRRTIDAAAKKAKHDTSGQGKPRLHVWCIALCGLALLTAIFARLLMHRRSFTVSPAIIPAKRPPLEPRLILNPTDSFYVNAPVPRLMPVYITPVLTPDESEWIISLAEQVNDWKARLNYDTREINVLSQLPEMVRWMKKPGGVQENIFKLFRRQFQLDRKARLSVDNSNIIRYDHGNSDTNHVVMHADGSLFTFNVALTDPKRFSGGGTGMFHLNGTVWPERGEMLTYYGNLYHSGEPVVSGRRYIWQGFCRLEGRSKDENLADAPLQETQMQVQFAEKVLSLHPGLYDAWFSAGNLMRKLGRYQESAPYLERALAAGHKDKLQVYGQLAVAHSLADDLHATREYMKKVLVLDPGDRNTRRALREIDDYLGPSDVER